MEYNNANMVEKTSFLAINEDPTGEMIIATGLLQEIANDSSQLNSYLSRFPGILNLGEEFRVKIKDYAQERDLFSAHDVAYHLGYSVGVSFTTEGWQFVTVYNYRDKPIAKLNWFEWSMTGERNSRIDMVRGNFGRMGGLLARIAGHIVAKESNESGLMTLLKIFPDFNLPKFCADELERTKRKSFLVGLQRTLRLRNTIEAAAPALARLDGLLTDLLDIVHSFEIFDEKNSMTITVRHGDDTYRVILPLGLLMPFSTPSLVENEIMILRNLNANKPFM